MSDNVLVSRVLETTQLEKTKIKLEKLNYIT